MNVNDLFSDLEPKPTPTAPQAPPPTDERERSGYWRPTAAALPDLPAPKQSKKWILFTVIGIVVAGALTGGYIAYSKGYLAIPGLTPKTEGLFDKMAESITDIKNAQYSLRLSIKGEPRNTKYTPIFKATNGNANVNASVSSLFRRGTVAGVSTNDNTNTSSNANANGNTNSASNTNSLVIENVGSEIGLGQASANPLLGLGGYSDLNDFYASLFQFIPSDINLSGGITVYLEADKKLSEADGSIRIDGSYTGSDISAAVDLEARKKNKDVFGVINKFPNIFIDTTAIKGKWVDLTSDDSDWFDPESLDEIDTREFIDMFKRLFTHALKAKLYTVKQKLPAETIAGVKSEHYLITVDPTKGPAVYDAFIAEERARNGKYVDAFETARKSYDDPEYLAMQQRIADNSRVEVWVDKVKGYLRQVKSDLIIVPPDNVEKLKGRQFLISMVLTMEKVNEKVSIDTPGNPIGFDEAVRLLTGVSKEDQQVQKQMNRTNALQSVLNAYQKKVGSYPESLDGLTSKMREFDQQCMKDAEARNANVNKSNANASLRSGYSGSYDYNCYLYSKYKTKDVNVTDVYTGKPYGYSKDGIDFKVTYEMRFANTSDRISYYKDIYAEGNNTMTSKDDSIKQETSSEKYVREHPLNSNTNTGVTPVTYVPAVLTTENPRGASDATVTMVLYTEFECPFCAQHMNTMHSLMSTYGGSVRWVVRQYPLESIHAGSRPAAIGALCARKLGSQEQYWRFVEDLFALAHANQSKTSADLIARAATNVGIDSASFSSCTTSTDIASQLKSEIDGGTSAKVSGVPTTFMLNKSGAILKTIAGAQPLASFTSALDAYTVAAHKDTDADGLSDDTETYVTWTDKTLADSDKDGYNDKTEVDGGYNPSGQGKATEDQTLRFGMR